MGRNRCDQFLLLKLVAAIFVSLSFVHGTTDPSDVQALQVLFTSLNNDAQLTNWKNTTSDPCGESWRGVRCDGSAVVSIQLPGLGIDGALGYMLSGLASLKTLNLSRNALSQTIGDIFSNLTSLATLDLSNNNFTGDLPNSLSSLSSISTIYGGNTFDNGPAPPPPPFTPPPPGKSRNNRSHSPPSRTPTGSHEPSSDTSSGKKLSIGVIVGVSLGSAFLILVIVLVLLFCLRKGKGKGKENAARTSTGNLPIGGEKVNAEMQEQRIKPAASIVDLKPPPTENSTFERGKNGSTKRVKSPITTSSYTVATLQTATNSFSQDNIIGEDNAALSLQEEDNFVEAVSNMSRLRHPNIVPLAGYCAEHGQRLLVYDYIANGSLQDLLHFADDRSKTLTWNARVRVALGTARALEYVTIHKFGFAIIVTVFLALMETVFVGRYLHEVCLPSVVSTQVVGSFGYSAPEFALSGIYTVKSDVYSFGVPEPEFRPPMSEVVQALVRLMQRASVVKRRSSDDSGFIYKTPDHEAYEMSY
ncbi:Concanavalin A-like lectin/glucanase, subgroup [Cynara cardunculus var. scolymus]|uniref:Concanavalin A-like lectin/glucanase, subgroup n=1 Tax=Cynara cardunculus var. scolymus TaxID=59895 RepID=A0A103YHU9_CYNCS|nr:Concanavalin A-like lectin/glucanase, subgroup [Cynara cardunculus var. scolymus]